MEEEQRRQEQQQQSPTGEPSSTTAGPANRALTAAGEQEEVTKCITTITGTSEDASSGGLCPRPEDQQLTDQDIVFGRGLSLLHRAANQAFRERLQSHLPQYQRSSKLGKDVFVADIVQEAMRDGIRFFQRQPGQQQLLAPVSFQCAIEKVKQAFRGMYAC
jgi:hypothetical protein